MVFLSAHPGHHWPCRRWDSAHTHRWRWAARRSCAASVWNPWAVAASAARSLAVTSMHGCDPLQRCCKVKGDPFRSAGNEAASPGPGLGSWRCCFMVPGELSSSWLPSYRQCCSYCCEAAIMRSPTSSLAGTSNSSAMRYSVAIGGSL